MLVGSALLAAGAVVGLGVTIPRAAYACSCAGPQPIATYATPENVILTGTVMADDPNGVVVAVEEWFSGTGGAPVVRIGGDFGDGASCGLGRRLPVGSRWFLVAWRPPAEGGAPPLLPDNGGLQVSICTPTGDLSTPEGQALRDEAIAAFGPRPRPATPDPAAAAPGPLGITDASVLLAGAGVLLLGVLVLAGAALAARRGRGNRPA